MALYFNGAEIPTSGDVQFNGISFNEVRFNGVTFWSKGTGIIAPDIPGFCNASDSEFVEFIRVMWGYSNYRAIYNVWRSENNVDFQLITSIGDGELWYDDLNVEQGVVYYYKVNACWSFDQDTCSDFSETDEGTLKPEIIEAPPQNAPLNLSASDGLFYDKINISWSNGSEAEATAVNIYRDSMLIGSVDFGVTIYTDNSVAPDNSYTYYAKFRNGAGEGPMSNSDAGSTMDEQPYVLKSGDTMTGNLIMSSCSININTGDIDINTGNIDVDTGDINVDTGNITINDGYFYVNNGQARITGSGSSSPTNFTGLWLDNDTTSTTNWGNGVYFQNTRTSSTYAVVGYHEIGSSVDDKKFTFGYGTLSSGLTSTVIEATKGHNGTVFDSNGIKLLLGRLLVPELFIEIDDTTSLSPNVHKSTSGSVGKLYRYTSSKKHTTILSASVNDTILDNIPINLLLHNDGTEYYGIQDDDLYNIKPSLSNNDKEGGMNLNELVALLIDKVQKMQIQINTLGETNV